MEFELREVILIFSQEGMVMENMRTPEWGRQQEQDCMVVAYVQVVRDLQ